MVSGIQGTTPSSAPSGAPNGWRGLLGRLGLSRPSTDTVEIGAKCSEPIVRMQVDGIDETGELASFLGGQIEAGTLKNLFDKAWWSGGKSDAWDGQYFAGWAYGGDMAARYNTLRSHLRLSVGTLMGLPQDYLQQHAIFMFYVPGHLKLKSPMSSYNQAKRQFDFQLAEDKFAKPNQAPGWHFVLIPTTRFDPATLADKSPNDLAFEKHGVLTFREGKKPTVSGSVEKAAPVEAPPAVAEVSLGAGRSAGARLLRPQDLSIGGSGHSSAPVADETLIEPTTMAPPAPDEVPQHRGFSLRRLLRQE